MKSIWVILFGLLLLGFAIAADAPDAVVDGSDVDNIQGAIDDYSPLNDSGKIDIQKYQPFKSKAEDRIDSINLWMDDNAGWMRFIFNMRPQISWKFFANLYFIFFFLTLLVFNGPVLWFFIQKKSNAILFGLGVFVALGAARLYVGLATIIDKWIFYLWKVFSTGMFTFIIILLIVGGILLIVTWGKIIKVVKDYFEVKKKFKENVERAASTEAVNKLLERATSNN
jgi:hypothetical protein